MMVKFLISVLDKWGENFWRVEKYKLLNHINMGEYNGWIKFNTSWIQNITLYFNLPITIIIIFTHVKICHPLPQTPFYLKDLKYEKS